MSTGAIDRRHIRSIDVLRGVAASMVVLDHAFEYAPVWGDVLGGMFAAFFRQGGLGVQVFFVISGFVLPYSMDRSGYQLRDFWRFLARRVVRLEPPYLISVLLAAAIAWYAPAVNSLATRANVTPLKLLYHVGYILPFFGQERWVNGVYWTLFIEFQFYLVVGLVFVWFQARSPIWTAIAGALTPILSLPLNYRRTTFLPYWMPVFTLGILVFQSRTRRVSPWAVAIVVASILIVNGPMVAVTASATAALIKWWDGPRGVRGQAMAVVGANLSYSLYLVHQPIVVHILVMVGKEHRIFAALLGIATSFLAAAALYWFVERPALLLAKRIRYSRPTARLAGLAIPSL